MYSILYPECLDECLRSPAADEFNACLLLWVLPQLRAHIEQRIPGSKVAVIRVRYDTSVYMAFGIRTPDGVTDHIGIDDEGADQFIRELISVAPVSDLMRFAASSGRPWSEIAAEILEGQAYE